MDVANASMYDGSSSVPEAAMMADQVNAELAEKKIIGGLPLGRFYPELKSAMLLCPTEMNKREDMDTFAAILGSH